MDLNSPGFLSLKRIVSFLLGLALVALNNKLGLGMSPEQQAMIVTLVLGFIGQSAYHEVAMAKAAAVTAVPDVAAAVAALKDAAK